LSVSAEPAETTELEQQTTPEPIEPAASKKSRLAELDNSNMEYERLLRARKSQPIGINHVSANIVSFFRLFNLLCCWPRSLA